jgi:hypothetical protein
MNCTRCKKRLSMPNRKFCAHCTEYNRSKTQRFNERNPTYGRDQAAKHRNRLRLEAVAKYGNACACCGETYEAYLEFDHINGGGRAERETLPHGIPWYRWLVQNPVRVDIQLLCGCCHNAKNRHLPCLPQHRGYNPPSVGLAPQPQE